MVSTEEKRERNRLRQARFQARRRGEIVPPRGSSYDDATPEDSPPDEAEHQQYLDALRQHLADVAAGDIQPSTIGSMTLQRRRWGGA